MRYWVSRLISRLGIELGYRGLGIEAGYRGWVSRLGIEAGYLGMLESGIWVFRSGIRVSRYRRSRVSARVYGYKILSSAC